MSEQPDKNALVYFEWNFRDGQGFRLSNGEHSLELRVERISEGSVRDRSAQISVAYDGGAPKETILAQRLVRLRYGASVRAVPTQGSHGRQIRIHCDHLGDYEAVTLQSET